MSSIIVTRLLWQQRALIWVLVCRDLNARYRASVLGFFWSFVKPLVLAGIFYIAFVKVMQLLT